MKKRLITSALPYVNNIPHLGNLIQVLSADVFARFCRQRGYETLYICGSDEYGTATETKASQEKVTPKELCDRFHKIHKEIYEWFSIDFDYFGRSSCPQQIEIVQHLYREIKANGFIHKQDMEQTFCLDCNRFLADRYIHGSCPHCHSTNARGDQCEDCGIMLEPIDLLEPRCGSCGQKPQQRSTQHLFLDLPALNDRLETWLNEASERGRWAKNALKMTKSWIRDGLKKRCITRDLSWGVPVPDMPGKVFYVWFDAPIAYISITAELLEQHGENANAWRNWWQNPKEVELFQFIGKDNIPFHTVLFPSSLLASQAKTQTHKVQEAHKTQENPKHWTMLHHMSSSEYLNYESGKFSKTRGIGIFGNDCQDTGISADCWRFYLYYNRPEKSDYEFTWSEFQQLLNRELIGNLGNLVNRSLSFLQRFFGGQLLPAEQVWQYSKLVAFAKELRSQQNEITEKLEWSQLKDALHRIMDMSNNGNKIFQEKEPWILVKSDRTLTHAWLTALVYLIHDLSICLRPYLPQTAEKMLSLLGLLAVETEIQPNKSIGKNFFSWQNLGNYQNLYTAKPLPKPQILFHQLENERIEELRARFAGSQSKRSPKPIIKQPPKQEKKQKQGAKPQPSSELWAKSIELRVGRIVEIAPHPDAERLFVEKIDCGETEPLTIVSSLAEHYQAEELLGQNVAVVANLKPVKLRGVKSMGMILAVSPYKGEKKQACTAGSRQVEVLHPQGQPGERIVIQGFEDIEMLNKLANIDDFFAIPLFLQEGQAYLQDTTGNSAGLKLQCKLQNQKLQHGNIG